MLANKNDKLMIYLHDVNDKNTRMFTFADAKIRLCLQFSIYIW